MEQRLGSLPKSAAPFDGISLIGQQESQASASDKADHSGKSLRLGPALLLAAFAALFLKTSSIYWSFPLIGAVGYLSILFLRKTGFFFSLLLLSASLFLFKTPSLSFSLFLALSISLSWWLILSFEERRLSLEKNLLSLEEQKSAWEQEQKEAKNSYATLSHEIRSLREQKGAWELAKREVASLRTEITVAKIDEKKFQERCVELEKQLVERASALEQANRETVQLKEELAAAKAKSEEKPEPTLIPLEETEDEKPLQYLYANLREQFEEKSVALDAARKELFHIENRLLGIQKEKEEDLAENSEEEKLLLTALKKVEDLEGEVTALQEIVTILTTPKKRTTRAKKGADST